MEENDFTGVTILKPKESSFGGFIAAGSWQPKLPLADGTDGPPPASLARNKSAAHAFECGRW
jgi:hypothetical protein